VVRRDEFALPIKKIAPPHSPASPLPPPNSQRILSAGAVHYPPEYGVSAQGIDFVKSLLCDESQRLGAGSVSPLSHPWFEKIDLASVRQSKIPWIERIEGDEELESRLAVLPRTDATFDALLTSVTGAFDDFSALNDDDPRKARLATTQGVPSMSELRLRWPGFTWRRPAAPVVSPQVPQSSGLEPDAA
jgi:hypothetical protein